jgi:DNA-binding transcriptional regulator GbsR (MarR family)
MEASSTRHAPGARKAGAKKAPSRGTKSVPLRAGAGAARGAGIRRRTAPLPPHDDAAFIERLGLLAEESGMPRMAGRVLAWLLICPDPRQSFGEIVEALGASKGSISAMTRVLLQLGLIERVTQGGDRRDFFQLHPEAWTRFLRQRVEMIRRFRDLAATAIDRLDGPPERQARLRAMHELYDWWEDESAGMLARWEAERARRADGGDTPSGARGRTRR